ncbi:BTAD domain-containing putative transcriptional regulator [Actinokineospora bangkokensis]|uniref:OmpR/PhoB-type domain-containing protein n=1 Tax=Actinokineospora bangkokensis TaxID=1193682 RepID=A0A1Q9LCM9_9PSEU|nr:BTAD domain-containing putative transcriptional regulator [Actinokineospora bangkokensis]OLR89769.1 hypothetical protein BJP25_01700 [Actinokineospora bangkokensis]
MQVAILGPLRVTGAGGAEVEPGGTRLRVLLARLALDAGRVVAPAALIDALWGERPPVDATGALQSLVSRLRRALRPAAEGALESSATGYRLAVAPDDVDAHRFERLAAAGRRAAREGRPAEAVACLDEALGLWRGPALAGLGDAPFAHAAAARLAELRASAAEDRLAAVVDLGGHADAVAGLRELVAEHPLRERAAGVLVRALALSGRQAEALAEVDRVRRALAEELGVEPSAELRELHLSVLRGDLAPAAARAASPALTSFIGRQAELAEVRALLGSARLVTLVGPGGAGKTRLAREVAAAAGGPTWVAELAPVRDPVDVAGAVLSAVGARDAPLVDTPAGQAAARQAEPLDRAVESLSAQPGLLVLDNCEHLVEAAAELADAVLSRCPRLTVLATSREPLAITGEVVFGVGPLGLPDEQAGTEEVLAADAVRLFADRAAAASPGFAAAEHAAEVARICRGLDGLPLALELAAARLRSMTLRQVSDRLDDRFRLLTGGSRTSLPRHRTLRAVVEWSWDLLDKPERLLLARLSVFPAPAAETAVVVVAADDDLLPAADVVYVLASLVEKSLVQVATGRDGLVRHRVLETVRAYAAERLAEQGPAEVARTRAAFTRAVLEFLVVADPGLRGHDQLLWMRRMAAEQDSLLAATRTAAEDGDAESAGALALRAAWFWLVSGQHQEAMAMTRVVAPLADRMSPATRATLRAMRTFDDVGGLPDREAILATHAELRAAEAVLVYPMLAMLGPMLAAFGGFAEQAHADIAAVADHPDPWARAMAQLALAFLLENEGDMAGAETAAQAALARFREVGDRWGQAMAIGHIAERRSLAGDHAAAIAANERAMRLVADFGSPEDTPGMLARLGEQRGRAGDGAGAEADFRAALAMLVERPTNDLGVLVRCWLATLLRRLGRLDDAVAEHAAATAQFAGLGRRSPHLGALHAVCGADLAIARGDLPAAWDLLRAALGETSRGPDMPVVAGIAEVAAQARWAGGDAVGAAELLGTAAALRGGQDLGNPDLVLLRAELAAALDDAGAVLARAAAADRAEALPALHAAVAAHAGVH